MYNYGLTKCFMSAVLVIGILLSPGFIVAAAESDPPCGPSGCAETVRRLTVVLLPLWKRRLGL